MGVAIFGVIGWQKSHLGRDTVEQRVLGKDQRKRVEQE